MDSQPAPIPVHWDQQDAERLRDQLEAEYARLRPSLREVDPGDLILILATMLKPFGAGNRFFLRELPGGGHVL